MADTCASDHARYLLRGEDLAQVLARALAAKIPDPKLRRSYARQAEEEARHAALFRAYLRGVGVDEANARSIPELEDFCRFLLGAVERGRLTTVVMGMNVALEGLSCVGFDVSARRVEEAGDDPAWVVMLRAIERDERRHVRLALPALRALGGGAIPPEAKEAMAEVREAAKATLENMGSVFVRCGIDDPIALFDAAVAQVHADLFDPLARMDQA